MNDQINLEALDAAIEWAAREDAGRHAEGDPRWNQGEWLVVAECGTVCCIAGWIVLAAGWVPDEESGHYGTRLRHQQTGQIGYVIEVADRIVIGNYAEDTVSEPYLIVSNLYGGGNDLNDIRTYRDQLAAFAAE